MNPAGKEAGSVQEALLPRRQAEEATAPMTASLRAPKPQSAQQQQWSEGEAAVMVGAELLIASPLLMVAPLTSFQADRPKLPR